MIFSGVRAARKQRLLWLGFGPTWDGFWGWGQPAAFYFISMKPLDSAAAPGRRWQPAMASAQLDEEHWRKNGQWFSLTRPLAELVVADQDLAAAFKRYGTLSCSRCCSCMPTVAQNVI